MLHLRSFLCILIVGAASLGASCSPGGNAGFVKRTTSAANDHIMFVREQPQTFGHQRLSALSGIYPDLGIFLSQQGFPEFLAETNKGGNRYLILYYLDARKAFACRSDTGKSRLVEFSSSISRNRPRIHHVGRNQEESGSHTVGNEKEF